ncbi:MAG: inositol monophosphatase [Patescibacteria group bacterium]|jgi:myo-inositol-1(or 4)-monophosphatase
MTEKDLKKFILHIAQESAKITRKGFFGKREVTWKPDNSPLTKTDLRVNKYLYNQIRRYFPDHGIISEELPFKKSTSSYTWHIDPIDGTIPFSRGIAFFTNSIGLAKGKEMILATVCDPIRNELFFAQKGKGAYLNGKKIKSTACQNMSQAYVDLELWPTAKYDLYQLAKDLTKKVYIQSRHASMAICFCYVAVGRMDAAFFAGDNSWDIAASSLICQEAGVKCTNLDGTVWHANEKPRGILVARPKLHRELVKQVKKYCKI